MLNCQLLTKTGETIQVYAKIKDYIEEKDVMLVEIFENIDKVNEKTKDYIEGNNVHTEERLENLLLAKYIKLENFETILVLEK